MFELPVLHPIFVHFPVALLPVAVVCDLLGRLTGRPSLTHAGWWTLLFATIASPITAATGWYWLRDMGEMHGTIMTVHQWLGTALPVGLIGLTAWRYRLHAADKPCSWPLLVALFAAVGAVTLQGHLGGMMTFGGTSHATADTGSAGHGPADASQHAPNAPSSAPTTSPADDGWRDSIRVEGHRHE